jgi:hypothetical protein
LALEPGDTEDALIDLQGHSITYRIGLGPHKGRKAFKLQSLPPREEPPVRDRVAQAAGFSLHAGVAAGADQRGTLERLCRYITRPAVAIERLSLTAQGHIRYALKTPYRDGTTHVIFEPLDFLARLPVLLCSGAPSSHHKPACCAHRALSRNPAQLQTRCAARPRAFMFPIPRRG